VPAPRTEAVQGTLDLLALQLREASAARNPMSPLINRVLKATL
jgi:hypothetical protein